MNVKIGDIVGRKSYNNDIFFIVDRIIKLNNNRTFAILKGISVRIEADAPIEDLKKVDERLANNIAYRMEQTLNKRIELYKNEKRKLDDKTGKILHLDGDRRYSENSMKYYKKIGLNAIVRNIPEGRQPKVVRQLLEKYEPDILIITGHDSMIKDGSNYTNIYNYRNSRHFIESVKQARMWARSSDKLFIFARSVSKFFRSNNGSGSRLCFISSEEF